MRCPHQIWPDYCVARCAHGTANTLTNFSVSPRHSTTNDAVSYSCNSCYRATKKSTKLEKERQKLTWTDVPSSDWSIIKESHRWKWKMWRICSYLDRMRWRVECMRIRNPSNQPPRIRFIRATAEKNGDSEKMRNMFSAARAAPQAALS